MTKLIAFRVDASIDIGTGHVMRCLTLAAALSEAGAECTFVCRGHNGNLLDLISKQGHTVCELPLKAAGSIEQSYGPDDVAHAAWLCDHWQNDAELTLNALAGREYEWLIVDHYALDSRWESLLRVACKKLMVIDDLADRSHDCNLLVDQNLGADTASYIELVPDTTKILVGVKYAMLRPEFAELRRTSLLRRRSPSISNILISLGGVDKNNFTGRIIDMLSSDTLPASVCVTVVMGPHSPWLSNIRQQLLAAPFHSKLLVGTDDMARLMMESDIAIGAAGSTSWERCCLGIPSILLELAFNQRDVLNFLDEKGAAIASEIGDVAAHLKLLCSSPELMTGITLSSASLVDGAGVARVVKRIEEFNASA